MHLRSIRFTLTATICLGLSLGGGVQANDAPYAGQEGRAISSLSLDDIAQIEAGAGWGLALPAELNGFPGPRHVLDAADELGLSQSQIAEVQAIFDAMNARAVEIGAQLLSAEVALDAAFELGDINEETLRALLADAGAARTELRAVHLAAHLETTPLLTRHQRVIYNKLRGYAGDGHDGHGGDH